jgi:hypothetical protein
MKLRADTGGLESLPLRLMIVAVVASLSIIPAAEALNNMRNKDFINRAELQLETVVSTAQLLAVAGPGGARTVSIDFSSDGSLAFESICIGDGQGPNKSAVVLRFTNGATMVKTCTDPVTWLRTREGGGLFIELPIFELTMSAQMEGRTEYVLVEVA